MNTRLFSLLNSKEQSYLIEANSPEAALVKAYRLGDEGWYIVDELSADEYCYRVTQTKLGEEYDELTDELYRYFKARINDQYFDAFVQADLIENLINIREHEDIIKYVVDNY